MTLEDYPEYCNINSLIVDKEPTIADILTILFVYYFFYPLVMASMIVIVIFGWWLYVKS